MTELPDAGHIRLEAQGPVLRLWLNRPELRNAMSSQMVREILATFAAIREDRNVRVVVLRGAGGTFCAGADLKSLAAGAAEAPPAATADAAGDREQSNRRFGLMMETVNSAPQAVIAAVEGYAMGGYLTVLPALILSGLMLGALGMLISSLVKQLENFAGVMNFVIFPMFFASSALYPLWRVRESSPLLYYVCELNPFTHAVELVRFALYAKVNWVSLVVVCGCALAFMFAAILAYDPARGLLSRRGAPGGEA